MQQLKNEFFVQTARVANSYDDLEMRAHDGLADLANMANIVHNWKTLKILFKVGVTYVYQPSGALV